MSTIKENAISKAIAIRLDPLIRADLENLAAKDGRSISSAIRKAIIDYLKTNSGINKTSIRIPEPTESSLSVHDLETPVLSFRLPEALFEALEEHARAKSETVSEIVRQAITRWITNVDLQKLGISGGQK